ncbi:MAG: hypothetical protein QOF96_708 [Actinomycetota bacterium]|jgi:hypothetical protein|nr:hypothetical protein [Actinomycetota bacterium]
MSGELEPRAAHPVAIVLGRLQAIEEAYVRCRAAHSPAEAFRNAVVDTLADDADIVLHFADGVSDGAYGVSGVEFRDEVVQQLEGHVADPVDLEAEAAHWRGLDVAAVSAAIATDDALARRFGRGGGKTGRTIVDGAVGAIIARASHARTGIGRRAKLTRALSIVERFEQEAARAGSSDPRARRQARWCSAVAESLRAQRR